MSRRGTLLVAVVVFLLAAASMAKAIRLEPAAAAEPNKIISPDEGDDKQGMANEAMEECEGAGEEECMMMRRTLAAHTDYIYTQEHHH